MILVPVLVVLLIAFLIYWFAFRPDPQPAPSSDSPATTVPLAEVDPLSLDESTGVVLDASPIHTAEHGRYLGKACELAYLPQSEGAGRFREQLNLSARLVSVDNTQAYVGENAFSIVIAFRGSENPATLDGFKDWLLTNARNFLVLPEGRIGTDFAAAGVGARFHRGFMSALAEVWEPLHALVDEAMRRKERPLWVTGHSLGGAIALLAAWRLHQAFIPVHRICTFGAPMIGNNAAAEAYHREFPNKIIRYVDHGDMVPKLPTVSLLSNEYDHVQREIVVGRHDPSSADVLLANVSEGSMEGNLDEEIANKLWHSLHAGIASHLMDNYLSRITEQNV